MHLGRAIKLCRTQKGYSQHYLAYAAGLSVSYLSLLERNLRDPNISTVVKVSEALNVPLPILMFLATDKDEIAGISQELAEKLSHTALMLMQRE